MNGGIRTDGWWRHPPAGRTFRHSDTRAQPWWRNAVIYEIGPWSFHDSNGSGTGDLVGVIQRLDYISSLGVDAIWLTPVYASPMDDYGYDITDMQCVGKPFGTMAQFEQLVTLAHQRSLKIVVDMVWNHTSAQHPWFIDSCKDRNGRYADWYVWADPGPDGGPPNNWLSAFNGHSGWKYVDTRKQYYFFNFLHSQPDLNWHNPEVREMALRCARFWLDRGIDGMRLDAVNFFGHDRELRDDPPRRSDDPMPDGIDPANPATRHKFVNSFCREETLDFLAPIRALCDEYPGVMLLGEVTLCEDSIALAAQYTQGDRRLHLAYHSALHFCEMVTADRLRHLIAKALHHFDERGICWIVGNHDYGRSRSYWGGKECDLPDAFFAMMAAILIALPGALCLWQGDELGLPEARIPEDIPKDRIKDPFGKLLYPDVKGRDGSRTPMPWQHDAHQAGFTSADTAWLPIPASHRRRAVDLQSADPHSLLNQWRELLHWRRQQAALQEGAAKLIDLGDDLLGIVRDAPGQSLLCLFNVSAKPVDIDLSEFVSLRPVEVRTGGFAFDAAQGRAHLPAWGTMFAAFECMRTTASVRRQAVPA